MSSRRSSREDADSRTHGGRGRSRPLCVCVGGTFSSVAPSGRHGATKPGATGRAPRSRGASNVIRSRACSRSAPSRSCRRATYATSHVQRRQRWRTPADARPVPCSTRDDCDRWRMVSSSWTSRSKRVWSRLRAVGGWSWPTARPWRRLGTTRELAQKPPPRRSASASLGPWSTGSSHVDSIREAHSMLDARSLRRTERNFGRSPQRACRSVPLAPSGAVIAASLDGLITRCTAPSTSEGCDADGR